MKTTIYYFTGTGNSLNIARKLGGKIPGAEIKNIAACWETGGSSVPSGSGTPESTVRIGFVFPTYAYGLPRMVKEFAETVPIPGDAYLFAVASNCGIPGPVLKQLGKILRKRGRKLHAGFAVLDPSSSLANDPEKDGVQKLMISANRGEKPAPSSSRIDEIAAAVLEEHRQPLEASNRRVNFLGRLLYPLALKRFKTSGRDFHADSSCSGCGICMQVCPRNNISIENGSPVWDGDCEFCHACIQWCPKSAIQYRELTSDKPRYKNPDVSSADMILRKNEEVHCAG